MLRSLFSSSSSKKIRVAINGFGRIGRAAFKILLDNPHVQVVAINDLSGVDILVNLLRYDSVYGKYTRSVSAQRNVLVVDGVSYPLYQEKDPAALPWQKVGVDVVLECTGKFLNKEDASLHIKAGARKVIISAPAKDDKIKTIVLGVNENKIAKSDTVISMASCTTNCLAPISDVIARTFGVQKALMSTIHAYTADQELVDGSHKDPRRARAAAINIVPTTTGAAIAAAAAVPALEGKFDGLAFRVPVACGSIIDAVYVLEKATTVRTVNEALRKAAGVSKLKGILTVTKDPIVSSDIVGNPASAIVDLSLTMVSGGNLVKVVAWYDNEWGYSNRLAELAAVFGKK